MSVNSKKVPKIVDKTGRVRCCQCLKVSSTNGHNMRLRTYSSHRPLRTTQILVTQFTTIKNSAVIYWCTKSNSLTK